MSTDSNTTMPELPEPMYLGCDPNAGPVYAFTGSHMREYAQSYAGARVQALQREVGELRKALERITNDCTARKAVLIARAAMASKAEVPNG